MVINDLSILVIAIDWVTAGSSFSQEENTGRMYSQASVRVAVSDPLRWDVSIRIGRSGSGSSAALVTERPEKGRLVIVRRGQSSREPRGSPRRGCGKASNLGSTDRSARRR